MAVPPRGQASGLRLQWASLSQRVWATATPKLTAECPTLIRTFEMLGEKSDSLDPKGEQDPGICSH